MFYIAPSAATRKEGGATPGLGLFSQITRMTGNSLKLLRGGLGWIFGKIPSPKALPSLAQDSGGVTVPGRF